MKLIIDIPEQMWERVKDGYVPIGIGKYLKNGKPHETVTEFADRCRECGREKVLDEIKAEFKSKADGDDWYHTTDGLVWEEAIEILDKHKAESEKKHDKEATSADAAL